MTDRSEYQVKTDQITLLLLFKALHDLGLATRRLKLEKLVYFANVFAKIFGTKMTNHEFFVWKYGPFSKQVYSDVEVVVTRGFVNAKQLDEYDESDERSYEYTITKGGLSAAEKAFQDEEFSSRFDIILRTLQSIGGLTSTQIRKLSYGELDFNRAREKGMTTAINPEFPLSARMAKLAADVAREEFRVELSQEESALLYLKLVEALAPKR